MIENERLQFKKNGTITLGTLKKLNKQQPISRYLINEKS